MRSKLYPSLFLLLLLGLDGFAQDIPTKETKAFAVKVTGTGRPMILIPGLSCGGHVWDGTVEHFKDRYECHVVTLAGFAGEPTIDGPMLEKVRDGLLQYIRDKKLERPVMIGHSLGAFMSFWLGATAPEQIGAIVAVDGMPFFPGLLDRKATAESAAPQAEGLRAMIKGQDADQFAFGQRMFLSGMITDPKNLEAVLSWSVKSDPKAVAQALYELMTLDLRPKVAAIRAPVLVIGAMEPPSKNAQQREENYRAQVATIAKHKVVFAPKARHFVQLDAPEFFVQQVEAFLAETSAGEK